MPQEAKGPRHQLRGLFCLAVLMQLIGFTLLASFCLATVRHSPLLWALSAVLFLFFLVLSAAFIWRLTRRLYRNYQHLRELHEKGMILSLHESLFARIAVDGGLDLAFSLLRSSLKGAVLWVLFFLLLLAIVSAVTLSFQAFLRGASMVAPVGIAVGLLMGGLVDLIGQSLRITEGLRIDLNVPGTATYSWAFAELVASRVIPGPAGFAAIEMEFSNPSKGLSRFRIVSHVKPETIKELCRMLGIQEPQDPSYRLAQVGQQRAEAGQRQRRVP